MNKKQKYNYYKRIYERLDRNYWFWVSMFLMLAIWGMTMNFVVIKNNQGRMPVLSEIDYNSTTHFSFTNWSKVPYAYFSDIIYVSQIAYYSFGDIFIYFAITMLVSRSMLRAYFGIRYFHYKKIYKHQSIK